MPISARTPTSGTAALSAAFTLTLPAGVSVGDFLVLVVTNAWVTSGPAAPTGWTRNYGASAGTGQFCCVYTARYSAGLTLNFTNVGAIAAWVCGAYFQTGFYIALDTAVVAATNTANNTAMSTGAPSTAQAGDYEVLAYGWGSNATITAAANMTIDRQQVNSTTCAAALGHNNTNPLSHPVTATAFAPTLSATNRAKTGVGILLKAYTVDLIGTSAGKTTASASGGGGPIALIASLAECPGTSHGFTTSALNTTGANLFIIGVGGINGPWTLTDSKGFTYSQAEYIDGSGFGNPRGNAIYYATGTGGPGHTFTIAGTSNFTALCVAAYSNAAASPLGSPSSHVSNPGATTSIPGSITPDVANALVVTTEGGQDSSATPVTISAGFSTPLAVADGGGRQMSNLSYQVQTAAVAANPTWTLPGSPANWSTIAFFKSVPSGGGLTTKRSLTGTSVGTSTASGTITKGTSGGTTYKDLTGTASGTSTAAGTISKGTTGTPPPGYALVASISGQGHDTFSTAAIDTTGANLLVVCWCQAQNKPTLSDNKGNTYVLARENDGGDRNSAISYVAVPTVGTNHILTLTGTDIYASAQFYAFSGSVATPLDQTGQAIDYTDVMSGPTLTPTEDGELLIAIDQFDNSATIGTWSPSGWSAALGFEGTGGSILGSCSSYLIQTAAAAATPVHTLTSPQGHFITMATFKASGVSTGTTRNLTGSASGASSVAATVTRKRPLVAASAGVAGSTATASRLRSLNASSAGVATASATSSRKRPLVPTTIPGVAATTASIARKRILPTVSSAGVAAETGQPTRRKPIVATSTGIASTVATATRRRSLSVSVAGIATTAATISSIPASPYDPDTAAYLAASGLDAATYGETLDGLVIGLKTAGLWTKMAAIYPFVGGTAALHKWNLKDPRDLDAAYRLTFNGGTHSTALGYKPNAAPDSTLFCGDTHFVPSGPLDINSTHLSLYSLSTMGNAARCDMGHYNWDGATGRFHIISHYTSGEFYFSMAATDTASGSGGDGSGLYIATRTSGSYQAGYRNGVLIGSSTSAVYALPNVPVLIGGLNGYAREYSDIPFGFASIGEGLTAQNATDLYTVVQAYQTALGRQVGVSAITRELTGSASGASTATATATRQRSLTAVSAGVASSTATLSRRRSLTVAATSTSTTVSTIVARRSLTASSNSTASATGSIKRAVLLTVASSGSTTASATIANRKTYNGLTVGIASAGAQVRAKRLLTATSVGSTVASGNLQKSGSLYISSAGSSTASATVTRRRSVVATSVGSTATLATASAKRRLLPTTSSAGSTQAVGSLSKVGAPVYRDLLANSAGKTTVAVSVTAWRRLTATSAGVTTVAVIFKHERNLIVAATGTSTSTGTSITRRRPLLAVSNGGSVSATATASRKRQLVASSAASTVSNGIVSVQHRLVGTSTGNSTTSAQVLKTRVALVPSPVVGTTTTTANINARRVLNANPVVGSTATSGSPTTSSTFMRGNVYSFTVASASVSRRRKITAVSAGSSSASTSILRRRLLSGNSGGTSTSAAIVRVGRTVTSPNTSVGVAGTVTTGITRIKTIIAIDFLGQIWAKGVADATALKPTRRITIVPLSTVAGKATVSTQTPRRYRNLSAGANGISTTHSAISNSVIVVWNGSTFALGGANPVVLWDNTEFVITGDGDITGWKDSTDQFTPVR
jgi:hypothetical protein